MSVIIRLQNLPWSANALDIRQYFRGLSIPEGGVHIVGGEQGDAFIAFSTDEDARQAMMADGGKIKEVKIKLMLSSRTEMQKVIELARQQSMSLHTFMQMPAPPIAPVHTTLSSLIGTLQATGVTSSVTTPPPTSMPHPAVEAPVMTVAPPIQPPTISPVNSNSNSSVAMPPLLGGSGGGGGNTAPVVNNVQQDRRDERKNEDTGSSRFKDRKERSRSREADRRKDRDRDRDRDRHRDRERDRRSSRRDRSRSRDRRRNRRDRSRTRERSRSRDRASRDRGRSSGRDNRRDSSVTRGSHSDEDKEKENNDVIMVGQYPNKDVEATASAKQPVKMPTVPVSSAPSKVSVPESQSMGHWNDVPTLGQQTGFKSSMLPPVGPASVGMGAMALASRQTQLGGLGGGGIGGGGIGGGTSIGGGLDMNLRAGSGFPGDLSRNLGSGMAGNMGAMSEPMQPSFMRDGGYPGSSQTAAVAAAAAALRARDSWPPSRQASDMSSRFGGRDRMTSANSFTAGKQDLMRGGNNFDDPLDEYDRGDFEPPMSRGFRGGGASGGNSFRGSSMDFRRGMYGQSTESRMAPRSLLAPSSVMDRMGGIPAQSNDILDRRGGAGGIGNSTFRNQFRGEADFPHHRGGGDRFGMDPYDRQYMNERHFGGRPSGYPTERFPPAARERFGTNDRGFEQRPQNVPTGPCVEIRHMPPEAGVGDIHKFFQGMYLTNSAVKIINDNHGNRVGIAYVKFAKPQDKEMGLHFTGKTIRGSVVEILHLEEDIFDKAIDSYKPPAADDGESGDQQKLEFGNQYVCLSVHDLPPYVKEEDIFKLFHGFTVVEVVMSVGKGPKKEYEAYVKFSRHEDAKKALHSKVKHTVGHKVVAVKPCTVEQLQEARKLQDVFEDGREPAKQETVVDNKEPVPMEMSPPKTVPQDTRNNNRITPEETKEEFEEPMKTPLPQATSDCILLKGLPVQANDRDILDFFSDVGLVPLRIHIMLDKFGKATGDAFCEFSSLEEASRSLTKHNTSLGKQAVNVIPITRAEMNEALGIPAIQPEPILGNNFRPPMLLGAGRNFARTGLLGASPASLSGRLPLMGGRGPILQDNPVEGFGKPGCVLSLENIPFKADIEEILEFFCDFDIARENVIRRFNERGLPTGEARVAFRTPSEAQRASRELRNGRIRGRSIFMRPL